jgi:hypothetical protein
LQYLVAIFGSFNAKFQAIAALENDESRANEISGIFP